MPRSCFSQRLNILLRVTFCLPAVMMILWSVPGHPKSLTAAKGGEATFECPFNISGNDSLYAVLQRKTALCEVTINSNMGQCNDRIRRHTDKRNGIFYFTINRLQKNDSDSYTCEVKRRKPAPVITLKSYSISLQVTAHPEVYVSRVEGPSGVPMLLCSSRNFDSEPIEQVWLRNGLPLGNTSHRGETTTNVDGFFNRDTFLSLQSEHNENVLYSCWVNHSSLSTPITVHYTPTPDGARTDKFRGTLIPTLVGVFFVVSLITFLFIFFQHQNIKKALLCCTSGSVRTAGHNQKLELVTPDADEVVYSVLWAQQKNKVNVFSRSPP